MTTSISNSNLTAQIKHLGAELFSLKNKQNKEYIWEGNPTFWGKHSPILFPIIGSLKNNSYIYNEKEYELNRHGFAREMEFELIKKTEESATFSLFSTLETKKIYPFDFELQICYSLKNNKLNIDYKVINKNEITMPFAIGAHPAFALPGNFNDYSLEFQQDETLKYYLLEEGLISNSTNELQLYNSQLGLTYQLFEKDALVFKTLKSKTITILKNANPILKVNFTDFPNLGIWTVVNAPFLCIEPWFGYSDTLNEYDDFSKKEGIQLLKKNETFESNYSIEIF
ncbi:aldose 1-epimerase family protein [Flavobacterium franklandianum]|uniref:Aldose 1-epimerase family protein n=1 Tax=Flavobacterium franklandianum TaxID=2594430 RepID=A0A553CJ58_9FLAO|nr:aldose 1-epimerase family protein [Flavobacterium franklandianum]TRX20531.1 aldose 1-epimerase family protein [Flavobacterium franklandianum]